MENKYFKFFIILLAVAVIVPQIALAAWWNPFSWNWGWVNRVFHFQRAEQKPVACTMEAKLCPDGSSVGRQGPKCEFAECPKTKKDPTANWKTYINTEYGFEFKYPQTWLLKETTKQSLAVPDTLLEFSLDKEKMENKFPLLTIGIRSKKIETIHRAIGAEEYIFASKKTKIDCLNYDQNKIDMCSIQFALENNTFYFISKGVDPRIDTTIAQIISTFKFINSQPVDWSKYSDDDLMAMYDSDWKNKPMYFKGLVKNYLIIDEGTAPPPRGLVIYDLNDKKEMLTDRYSNPLDITKTSVAYWTPTTQEVTSQNCPESVGWMQSGLGAEFEKHVSFNFTTLVKENLNDLQRCRATQ